MSIHHPCDGGILRRNQRRVHCPKPVTHQPLSLTEWTRTNQRSTRRYREVQRPPKRYRVVDMQGILGLLGVRTSEQYQRARANWVDAALQRGLEG